MLTRKFRRNFRSNGLCALLPIFAKHKVDNAAFSGFSIFFNDLFFQIHKSLVSRFNFFRVVIQFRVVLNSALQSFSKFGTVQLSFNSIDFRYV